jgi:hypothetical protein
MRKTFGSTVKRRVIGGSDGLSTSMRWYIRIGTLSAG